MYQGSLETIDSLNSEIRKKDADERLAEAKHGDKMKQLDDLNHQLSIKLEEREVTIHVLYVFYF